MCHQLQKFSAVSPDRIVPATADVKTAAIATPIVRSFNIHLDGQPDVIAGAATTNAIIMDQPGGDIRITNVFIHNKFAGDKYNGWLISSGNLIYDFSEPAAAVRGDATVTGGSGSFAGASGTLTTEILSGVGTATAKLQIPNRHCYAAQGGSAFPK
ncbi:hypothetical protein OEZ85_000788 [Tetradesmus obliquus]|uniref:Dirigent protein n=1 Tax=Tetradesmus obliquus TaxID=3088 RepID=A0ABY8UMU6_TETOB|nr:hypothetical protein OEZ85_000788 [Tetradesmus obliquus]